MFNQLLVAGGDWAGFVLRITAGLILWPHGAQKLLGWFGGYGFTGTMNFFTGTMKIPWILGFLVIVVEFLGSISLLAGFAVRYWAAAGILLMLGIITTSHLSSGFFMNWSGSQNGEGYEYHLLFIGIFIALLVGGAGRFSVDGALAD